MSTKPAALFTVLGMYGTANSGLIERRRRNMGNPHRIVDPYIKQRRNRGRDAARIPGRPVLHPKKTANRATMARASRRRNLRGRP